MVKKIQGYVKLQIVAGKANPAPPIGPALGQYGVNIMDFCKKFNAKTQKEKDNIIPVVITIYQDRSFSFIVKSAPTSFLLKKILNLKSGSKMPHKDKVGKLTESQITEVAKIKLSDLNCLNLESAKKQVRGTAVSMGLTCEEPTK